MPQWRPCRLTVTTFHRPPSHRTQVLQQNADPRKESVVLANFHRGEPTLVECRGELAHELEEVSDLGFSSCTAHCREQCLPTQGEDVQHHLLQANLPAALDHVLEPSALQLHHLIHCMGGVGQHLIRGASTRYSLTKALTGPSCSH